MGHLLDFGFGDQGKLERPNSHPRRNKRLTRPWKKRKQWSRPGIKFDPWEYSPGQRG